MQKKLIRRLVLVVLAAVMITTALPKYESASASATPAKPKITVKSSEDGTSVTVTVKKTENADGYVVEAKLPGTKKYTAVRTIELDGKKKRSVAVDTLIDGKYSFRVKAYSSDGTDTVWGKYSKVKKVTVKTGFDPKSLGIKQGDIVTFGACDQDGKAQNGKEPIDWIVLSNKNGKLFLTSVYVLEKGIIDPDDYWDYDDWDEEWDDDDGDDEDGGDADTDKTEAEPYDGTWKNSRLRKHLNEEFLTSAFGEKEISYIADTELADAGCTDKVFLLSKYEIENAKLGFKRQEDRICAPASFALGVWVYTGYADYGDVFIANENRYSCYWWLRTPLLDDELNFYLVGRDGGLTYNTCYGDDFDTGTGYDFEPSNYLENGEFGVRPALVLNLKNGVQNVLTKTGKNMKEEWANAGYVQIQHEDYDEDYDEEYDDE